MIAGITTAELIAVLGHDFDTALECLPPIITASIVLTKYLNGVIHVKQLKNVCHMIKSDSERLKNLPEYDVLYMHAMEGRKFCVFFVVALQLVIVVYLALPAMLIVNDLMMKNKSVERYIMYKVTYVFADPQNYYYTITIHCYLASLLIILFICPFDTMYITFTQHACAMFAVVGYRLKTLHILDAEELKAFGHSKRKSLLLDEQERMYRKLVLCVKEHKRALECTEIVHSAFSAGLFFQIMLNIICLSVTGVQTLLKLSMGSVNDVIRLVTWMLGQHIHLCFLHLPGQRLLDSSMQVYYDALECMWYNCFTKFRVTYQIMVMRTLTPVKLTALKIRPLNMEAFLSVTQTAVSYFTVLSSTI